MLNETQLSGNLQKAREGHSKRHSNRTTQENQLPPNHNPLTTTKTIDFSKIQQLNARGDRSGSSINTSKEGGMVLSGVGSSSNSVSRKFVKEEPTIRRSLPMAGDEACKVFHSQLSPFEREEIRAFDMVYYMNPPKKRRDAEENGFNNGFDTEDGDYLFETGEHINYRYEISKKLGRGAFGVVLKCIDHLTQEAVALKILKNQKKLHKQGKIEIKLLTLLRDNDPDDKKNIVFIKDSFTFRNHIVRSLLSF